MAGPQVKKLKKKLKKEKKENKDLQNQLDDSDEGDYEEEDPSGAQAIDDLTPTPEELAATRAAWEQQVNSAAGTGREDIVRYFQNMGLDPTQYGADIDQAIASARAGVPDLASPGSAFTGLGQRLYTDLENALRARSMREANTLDPMGRIENTADDSIIAEILNRERGEANQYAQNLLDRGVITESGFTGIQGDLEQQGARAQGLLTGLGDNLLAGGQGELDALFGQAKGDAGGLLLGEDFNAQNYQEDINKSFDDFMTNLGSQFEAQLPGDLFKTSGLGSVAGAAQGAQNTKYDRNALSGIYDDPDEERGLGNVF